MASTKSGMASALAGGPRASLANSPRLAAARKRMTGGHRVLFAYADLEFLVDVFKKLIPPIVYDMNEINGLASLKGLGLGVSITEGGIRESVGIIFDGNPKGVWTVLDANITTLIAALVLFQFGTGPVKGFAVTLSLGLLSSMFTAIFVTRCVFDMILQRREVQRLSI